MTIKELKPTVVWNNFYQLTRQPRPSKHEEKVREFLLKWGKEHKIDTKVDDTGNVIMRVPATPGFENRKGIILQGHMDMVPQKIASSGHNFLTDPIETVIDGDWVTANGTTLGADNGLGVALAMSVAESKDVKHGPIEVLVTYDEETGMTGASSLKPGILKGDILLNLDSEDDEELCIGCAGGLDAEAVFKYKTVRAKGMSAYLLSVKGLQGGHSGMDISLYRANANKVAANALVAAVEKKGAEIVKFTGGSLRNAIPFEAEVEFLVPKGKEKGILASIRKRLAVSKDIYKESDPNMEFKIEKAGPAGNFIEHAVALNLLKSLLACPSNVIRMSQSMEGLTETSINMAIVRTGRGRIVVHSLLRSAIDEAKAELAERVRFIFEMAGAKVSFSGGYSGWKPNPESPLIALLNNIHKEKFGKGMNVLATHGGLECAIMGAAYPHWEMISIGPTVKYPHSPDERCHIPSVERSWEFLKAILENAPVR
ncbi:MAG: aminoacyl-histidine dipeptidase [Bacteroidales bacterium]|nr:aminoacyl-histidine dipeptidase [Bacteroidales bacterium]